MEKMEKSTDEKLDKLWDTVAGMLTEGGGEEELGLTVWPFHPSLPRVLYWGGFFLEDLWKNLKELDEKGYTDEEIAKLFKGSGRLTNCFFNFDSHSLADLTEKEKIWLAQKLLDVLGYLRKEDIFCERGRNVRWGKEQIKEKVEKVEWTNFNGNKGFKNEVLEFGTLLWSYCELIYFANHPIGHEFHGPYDINDGKLFVKEFCDLKPEVWDFNSSLKFERVKLFEVYSKDTEISVDFFARGTRSASKYREGLKKVYVEIDDEAIENLNQLRNFKKNLEDISARGKEEINPLGQKELFKKYMEIWYWVLRPSSKELNKSWKPPDKAYEKFKENIDPSGVLEKLEKVGEMPKEKQKKILRDRFDPRGEKG